MNNYMTYNQNSSYQPYQATQYFPQPQGSIYMIGNSNDVANVPVGAGLSAAICLREGIIYLKTIQNGSPMLLGYRLSPLEGNGTTQEQVWQKQSSPSMFSQGVQVAPVQENQFESKILATLESLENRLKKLENSGDKSKGGASNWPL